MNVLTPTGFEPAARSKPHRDLALRLQHQAATQCFETKRTSECWLDFLGCKRQVGRSVPMICYGPTNDCMTEIA